MRAPRTPAARAHLRPAERSDLPAVMRIYNHYVRTSPCTFDVRPFTVAEREPWWGQFARTGRHRLIVAEVEGSVVGYAGSTRFRDRRAYDTTVETTVYCRPGATGRGLGSQLYGALFEALGREDVALAVAGFTLPNPASARLHVRWGFRPVGVFHRVGRKFGKFWDVQWNERPLEPRTSPE